MTGASMEKTEPLPSRTIILDAGPIIHLDELACLSLLSDFQEVIVPETVWLEVERHRPAAFSGGAVRFVRHRPLYISSHLQALCEAFSLDAGEREALSLTAEYPNALLLTDDAAVRIAAKAMGIRAYGTIGILVRAIRRKQKTPGEVISLLEQVSKKSTLFIRESLVREIIDKIQDEQRKK